MRTTKLSLIKTIPRTDPIIKHDFIISISIPLNATHFIVFTKTAKGEMMNGVSTLIVDARSPQNAAQGLQFADKSFEIAGTLGGTNTIYPATNESDIAEYAIYWGFDSIKKIGLSPLINSVPKNLSPLALNLPLGTRIPTTAKTFLVFTKNASGEMSSGIFFLLMFCLFPKRRQQA